MPESMRRWNCRAYALWTIMKEAKVASEPDAACGPGPIRPYQSPNQVADFGRLENVTCTSCAKRLK